MLGCVREHPRVAVAAEGAHTLDDRTSGVGLDQRCGRPSRPPAVPAGKDDGRMPPPPPCEGPPPPPCCLPAVSKRNVSSKNGAAPGGDAPGSRGKVSSAAVLWQKGECLGRETGGYRGGRRVAAAADAGRAAQHTCAAGVCGEGGGWPPQGSKSKCHGSNSSPACCSSTRHRRFCCCRSMAKVGDMRGFLRGARGRGLVNSTLHDQYIIHCCCVVFGGRGSGAGRTHEAAMTARKNKKQERAEGEGTC